MKAKAESIAICVAAACWLGTIAAITVGQPAWAPALVAGAMLTGGLLLVHGLMEARA